MSYINENNIYKDYFNSLVPICFISLLYEEYIEGYLW